ncbi:hypothetical protein DC20_17795 [Rufibacter tibetensis]|uniref:Uncharacterized protein n=2 Tax=Rufibacter tibetensis TaxID=512763 RepID=A0A0N7HWX7_9BACT|nr:hypothetical protein DC20_17795 [Rufibacter tibetensis]
MFCIVPYDIFVPSLETKHHLTIFKAMENLTILQLLLQVMLFFCSFTALVFGYVFLTSNHGAAAVEKAVSSSERFPL